MTEFKIGDRVFARVRSYPFWPAKIEYLPGKKRKQYTVIFYFTLQKGFIDLKSLEPFNDETIIKFKPLCKNRNFFREALEDALVDEANEGIHIRSDEIKTLPLYEKPQSKRKQYVVPSETATARRKSAPSGKSSLSQESIPSSEDASTSSSRSSLQITPKLVRANVTV